MRRRNRQNVPIFVALAAVVLIVLVLALGSLGGGGDIPGSVSLTGSPGPTVGSTPAVVTKVAIPPSMLETPAPPGTELSITEDEDTGLKYVDGDVIVKFSPGVTVDLVTGLTSSQEINTFLSAQQIESFDNLASLPEGLSLEHVPIISQYYKITFPQGTDVLALSESLSSLPSVEFATVNAILEIDRFNDDSSIQRQIVAQPTAPPSPTATPLHPDDPCYDGSCAVCQAVSGQWALNDKLPAKLGVPDAWRITTGSSDVVVAVIDTGVDLKHPEFEEKYAGHGYDFINEKENVVDEEGHGTSVAGIIAAGTDNGEGIAGMSWGARIMPLKACDKNGNCSEWDVAEAILWAAHNDADIINLSLLFKYGFLDFEGKHIAEMFQDMINHVHEAFDTVVIASAGNANQHLDDTDKTYHIPAELANVIAVGATNEKDEVCRPDSSGAAPNCKWGKPKSGKAGSGQGPLLDVVAPGSANICTTQPQFNFKKDEKQDGYRSNFGGTSAAAPFVSGLAALMLSADPSLTSEEVEQILKETADHLGPSDDHLCGSNIQGNDDYGCGRINARAALEALEPPGPPLPASGTTATVLVMDVSGSMGESWQGGVKIESAKSAANQVINMLQQESQVGGIDHRLGLARFSTRGRLELGLSTEYDQARATVSGLRPSGNTNMGEGLIRGNEALSQATSNESRIIILLSDGMSNAGLPRGAILSGPVQEAANAGTCIYTVGFGDPGNLDEALLRQIAAASGCGDYYYANVGSDLERVYIRIRHVSTGDLLAEFAGTVSQGQTVQAGTFEVPSGQGELAISLHWPGSALDLRLTDPRGREVDRDYSGASIVTYPNLVYALIEQPVSGTWLTSVYGREVPQGTTSFDAIVSARAGGTVPVASPGAGIAVLLLALIGGGVAVYSFAVRRPALRRDRQDSLAKAAVGSLALTTGPLAGQTIPLTEKGLLIGRGTGSDLNLKERSISRQHARIRYADGAWFIQDLGSSGGTFVNGQRIQASRLKAGDQIKIGDTTIVFQHHPK